MNSSVESRTFSAAAHLSKAGARMALARWLRVELRYRPIAIARLPGREWTPTRLCYREPA